MRRRITLALTIALVVSLLAWASPASAWRGWGFGWNGWAPPAWSSIPGTFGYRHTYPPGYPLSFSDPTNGATYCLSERAAVYYPCGYSPPTPYPAGSAPAMPPPGPPIAGREFPPPSGVLLFQLPPDAEVTLDGVPVGLSRGLGIVAVPPGQHSVILHVSGSQTRHAISVSPHAILIVTPTAITPSSF